MDSDQVIIKQGWYAYSPEAGKRLLPDPGTERVLRPTSDPSSSVQAAVEQLIARMKVEIQPRSARETAKRFSVYEPDDPDQHVARQAAVTTVVGLITQELAQSYQRKDDSVVTWSLAGFGGGSGIFLQEVFKDDGLLNSQRCFLIDSTNAVHCFFFHDR